jgi:hypothetical protein
MPNSIKWWRLTDRNTDQDPILTFLGPTADHPDVISSKLTHKERTDLDGERNIREFDQSVRAAKLNSSPGVDGISNRFIANYWHFSVSHFLGLH